MEQPLDKFGPLTKKNIIYYRGNRIWEEKSPPKGRRQKRMRSNEITPEKVTKKQMLCDDSNIVLRPKYFQDVPTATSTSSSNLHKKISKPLVDSKEDFCSENPKV